jgi:hypothetical protein
MKLILTRPIMHEDPHHRYPKNSWTSKLIQVYGWHKGGIDLDKIDLEWNDVWNHWDLKVYSTKKCPVNFDVLPEFFMSMDLEKMNSIGYGRTNDPDVIEVRRYFLYPKEENGLT